jgi:UDP-N-acetylmuramate dehydrogenase
VPLTEALARLKVALSGDVRADEPMARHTTYRVGGPAAIHAQLDTVSDVTKAISVLGEEGVAWTVVGKGSNLLVSDAGYVGAVLTGSPACRGLWAFPVRSVARLP